MAKLIGAGLISSTILIPYAGPFISVGLGSLDAAGTFDDFYDKFDRYLPPPPRKK